MTVVKSTQETVLWSPRPLHDSSTRIGAFASWLSADKGLPFADYDSMWRWSTDDPGAFWEAVWEHFDLGPRPPGPVLRTSEGVARASWFGGTTLNYADLALSRRGDQIAIVSISESSQRVEISRSELADLVDRAASGLRSLGVGPGDRVAGYLPNVPEAVVAFLATASIGAIWSACSPELGARAVLDRLSQIRPKVLVAVDGYRYAGRDVDRSDEVGAIRDGLHSLEATVLCQRLRPGATAIPGCLSWEGLLSQPGQGATEKVPFEHPLWTLFSSGTTGPPKAIVQSHGGILLEHLKSLALHCDLGEGDRFFWFSTTSWMMWNFLVSGLLVGATIVLFDGSPGYPSLDVCWEMAAAEGVTYFGTSAPFLTACRRSGLEPGRSHDLSRLRAVGSTGAPLSAEGFDFVYEKVSDKVLLSSLSGGTDVCTAVVGGCPIVPVWRGEISCRWLGAKVESFDSDGRSVVDQVGELVITEPMPSMPLYLWGDDDGSRYRAAYFERFPGVWSHGDWITITSRGSCVITGRSDATLNRGGVRLGSAELYSVLEGMEEIDDSLVVHLDTGADAGDDELVLFVVVGGHGALDQDLERRIRSELRRQLSPRHVPDSVIAVDAVPRTLSGKRVEVPIKRILLGEPVAKVLSPDALSDPGSLEQFVSLAAERKGKRLT